MSSERKTPKSITTLVFNLVRAHYDDTKSFDDAAYELARYYDDMGAEDLAAHIIAQRGGAGTFTTMDPDPIDQVALDMFSEICRVHGPNSPEATQFYIRLQRFMPAERIHSAIQER